MRVSLAGAAPPAPDDAQMETVKLLFTIRDTGIGIPEDRQGHLFHDFAQADASIARRFGGTGLGLAICRRLVETMGGEIGVQSVPAKGSTFWFTLPLRLSGPQGGRYLGLPGLKGVRVLVVDDNATNRETLLTRFTAWGMHADEAMDGRSALELASRAAAAGNPYRLAVIDHDMPGMDGEALGRAMRADGRLRATRLLLMTPLGRREDATRLRDAGFSAHLCKPVLHGELLTCVHMVLNEGARPPARHSAPPETRPAIPDFSGRDVRILLVEDNVTNQQVALGLLNSMGLTADTADNGAMAIEALAGRRYDLVLMDLEMPVMDGFECTRLIRGPSGPALNHDVPIVAMTAHVRPDDRDTCLEAGMNGHVPKPISVPDLAAALNAWLPSEGTQSAAAGPQEDRSVDRDEEVVWDRNAFMERIMNDEDLARDILSGFRADTLRRLGDMRRALAQGDLPRLASQAHSIKGAAANLGANRLRSAARDLESAGAADGTGAGVALARLEKALSELLDAVRRYR
jgi:CheY-like chemotaxis protein/HPt (histidine-containing phosphotransfer) domain-containing protein